MVTRTSDASRNPRLPVDLGLPALGLLMQLQAALALGLGAMMTVILLVAPTGGGDRLTTIGVLVLGLIRGVVHINAGRAVSTRAPNLLSAVRSYIITAIVCTVATILLLGATIGSGVPGIVGFMVGLTAFLLAWPMTLALLVNRPAVRSMFAAAETFDVDVVPSDRSIEGAGVLMAVLGAMGLGVGLLIGVGLLTGHMLTRQSVHILVVLVVVALIVRSGVHLWVGLKAAGGVPPQVFTVGVGRYVFASVVSVVLVVLALMLMVGGASAPIFLLLAVCFTGVLLAWPLILQGFARAAFLYDPDAGLDIPDGGAPGDGVIPFGPAPDRGLTAFGYLLLWFGTMTLSTWFMQLTTVSGLGLGGLLPEGTVDGHQIWLPPIVGGITLWAGIEMVTMSERYRLAGILYAVIAFASAILEVALVGVDVDVDVGLHGQNTTAISFLALAISFIMPLTAIILVHRRLPARSPA